MFYSTLQVSAWQKGPVIYLMHNILAHVALHIRNICTLYLLQLTKTVTKALFEGMCRLQAVCQVVAAIPGASTGGSGSLLDVGVLQAPLKGTTQSGLVGPRIWMRRA